MGSLNCLCDEKLPHYFVLVIYSCSVKQQEYCSFEAFILNFEVVTSLCGLGGFLVRCFGDLYRKEFLLLYETNFDWQIKMVG